MQHLPRIGASDPETGGDDVGPVAPDYRPGGAATGEADDPELLAAGLSRDDVAFCRRFGLVAVMMLPLVALFVLFILLRFALNIVHVLQGRPG